LIKSSVAEEFAFHALAALKLQTDKSVKRASQLFKTTLEKALFSSPFACVKTLVKRLAQLSDSDDSNEQADCVSLQNLLSAVQSTVRQLQHQEDVGLSGDFRRAI
jgi:hypothetical protein